MTLPGICNTPAALAETVGFVDPLFASPQLHLPAQSTGCWHKMQGFATAVCMKVPRIWDALTAVLCFHGVWLFRGYARR